MVRRKKIHSLELLTESFFKIFFRTSDTVSLCNRVLHINMHILKGSIIEFDSRNS